MKFCLEAACCCNIGYKRKNNEDNFYFDGYILPQENNGLEKIITAQIEDMEKLVSFGVFDGIGGEDEGQVASYIAADILKKECVKSDNYGNLPRKFLENATTYMNSVVCQVAKLRHCRMGTTVAMLSFLKDKVYACNVGDSKIFRLHQGELSQISEDHTDAKILAECGIYNRKPRLSQYIGIAPDEMIIEPHIVNCELRLGDQYLICSDGLTDMVSDIEINSIMKKNKLEKECAEHLTKAALEYGGRDNVTVIVIKVNDQANML